MTCFDHEGLRCSEEVDWATGCRVPTAGCRGDGGASPTDVLRARGPGSGSYRGILSAGFVGGGAEPLALLLHVPDLRRSLPPLGAVTDHLSCSALVGNDRVPNVGKW